MSRRMLYRRRLLQAVEAFLERTPEKVAQARRIIERCSTALQSEKKDATLDQLMWHFFLVALSDSVYYESEIYLRETHEILLGHSSKHVARVGMSRDFRPDFTSEEAAWYAQLLSMVEFLTTIPFGKLRTAIFSARQNQDTWSAARTSIPELQRADELEKEYQRRKDLLEVLATQSPVPKNMGDEKIFHIVLREVTNVLTGLRVGAPPLCIVGILSLLVARLSMESQLRSCRVFL